MNKDEMLSGPGGPSVVRGPSLKPETTNQCPKCHAGAAGLEWTDEHLGGGAKLQTVRCVRCGWRASRTVLTPPQERRAAPAATVAPQPAPAPAAPRPHHGANLAGTLPCALEGCGNLRRPRRDGEAPLCHVHKNRLEQWHQGRQTLPAPFVAAAAGVWIVNPERLDPTKRGPGLPATPARPEPRIPAPEPQGLPELQAALASLSRTGNAAAAQLLAQIEGGAL